MEMVEYRRLTPADTHIITMDYDTETLERFLRNPDNYLFAGIAGGRVVAWLYGYGLMRPDGRSMFYIHSVDVVPERQGMGIGTELMAFTLAALREEKKYYKYFVLADPDNERACRLYRKVAAREEQLLFSKRLDAET